MNSKKLSDLQISVIIPTYNAAQWLPRTIPRVEKALKNASIDKAELIVVDDGSSDGSGKVAESLKTVFPLRVIRQQNSGRFVARKTGTDGAKYEYILFIDTRIYIAPGGLQFIAKEILKNPKRQVWTSHVYLDKSANIYARFWDALTSIAWRKYFKNPRDYSYGLREFDYYPKGTTCFFVPKKIIKSANEWFFNNTKNLKTSNDDTLLIRHIAQNYNININPKFSCTYHARSSFRQYAKHVFHRGKVFVDGFLRRDGNRFYWPLVAFLVLSVLLPIGLLVFPQAFVPLLLAGLLLWAIEFPVCLMLGVSSQDSLSLALLTPIFGLFYGAGIWTAFIQIYILKRHDK